MTVGIRKQSYRESVWIELRAAKNLNLFSAFSQTPFRPIKSSKNPL